MAEKNPALDAEKVINLVNNEFETAVGAPGGEISLERAENMQYYLGEPYGNEEEGSSQVTTHDVEEVVDTIMPQLMRMFTTADNLVTFDAVGEEDKEAAAQESDAVTYTFFKEREDAFEILWTWCFDALVQKVGYVQCYWDEREERTVETYEGLNEEGLKELLADDEYDTIDGEPLEQYPREVEIDGQRAIVTLYRGKLQRTRKSGMIVIENVPPDEFRISSDANKVNPRSARFKGREREVTRSYLIEMGFDKEKVESLAATDERNSTPEKQQRNNKTDDQRSQPGGGDKSQETVLLREGFIEVDMDGDGVAELKHTFSVGSVELEIEDVDRDIYHALCPHPLPHKHVGRASADKVKDNQLITSTILRQSLDNLYHTNRPGTAIWEQAIGENTLDDLLTPNVGRFARFTRPVTESFATMAVPFTASASFPMLEYFDRTKRDLTGVGSDGEGLNPEDLKHVQKGVLGAVTDTTKMKVELIARIFAETGFKSLFLHIRELLHKHQDREKIIQLRGKFVPIRPKEWRERRDTTVQIGLGIGTREQNQANLDAIWERQKEIVQNGGLNLLVKPKHLYNTCAESVKNANFKDPTLFFADPGDAEAPPPSKEQEELQRQQQQLVQRQQQLDAQENQLKVQRLMLDAKKAQEDNNIKMRDLERKIEKDRKDFIVAMENVSNELTKIAAQFDRQIPGARGEG